MKTNHLIVGGSHPCHVAMLAKLLLLLIYLLLVFLAARVLDISSTWFKAGCLATQLLNPFALSVKKLKSILEQRGVSYTGLVEKKELAELVEASGAVTEAENCSIVAENREDDKEESEEHVFTSASHFFEEVEDTKAGCWLVDVIPEGSSSLLLNKQWLSLRNKIARFGIRIGTFRCENDFRLCRKYGLHKPSLLLSMPQGNQPKGNVILTKYDSKPTVDGIVRWINTELTSKVTSFNSIDEFSDTFEASLAVNPVYVVFFSTLPKPPLYLCSLSVHFTGRVRFGHVRIDDWMAKREVLQKYNIASFPSLMIFMPEKNFAYGFREGDCLNYPSLELFLKTIHPEVNDIFVIVLAVVNLSCFMELFLISGGILRRILRFTWILTFYNSSLIMMCLPVLALFQFPSLTPVLDFGLKCCRYHMTSDAAAVMRNYFLLGMQYRWYIFLGYVLYGFIVQWTHRQYKHFFGLEDENNNVITIADWFTQDLHYLARSIQTFPSLGQPQVDYSANGFEDGFELLVRRLAVPELWLRPLIPSDYVKSLPVWKFCCCCEISQSNDTKPGHCKKRLDKNNKCCRESLKPPGMLVAHECAICLEDFSSGCFLLGLPCGHSYHQHCIEVWLCGGSASSHYCCPVCRWPAYKKKPFPLKAES